MLQNGSTLAELRLEYLELLVKSLEFGGFTRLLMLQCPEIGINNLKVVPQVNEIPGCGLTPNHFLTSELVLAAPIYRNIEPPSENGKTVEMSVRADIFFLFFGWWLSVLGGGRSSLTHAADVPGRWSAKKRTHPN